MVISMRKFNIYKKKGEMPMKIGVFLSGSGTNFERLKFIRGWAGIYGETPDKSGFMGKVTGLDNVYECAGHTGRGIMISYGLAEALTDMLIDGRIRDQLTHAAELDRRRPSGPLMEQLHL